MERFPFIFAAYLVLVCGSWCFVRNRRLVFWICSNFCRILAYSDTSCCIYSFHYKPRRLRAMDWSSCSISFSRYCVHKQIFNDRLEKSNRNCFKEARYRKTCLPKRHGTHPKIKPEPRRRLLRILIS